MVYMGIVVDVCYSTFIQKQKIKAIIVCLQCAFISFSDEFARSLLFEGIQKNVCILYVWGNMF